MSTIKLFLCMVLTTCFTIKAENTECVVNEYDEVENALETCTNIVIDNVKVPAGNELTLNIRDGCTVTFRGNTTFEQVFWKGPLVHINGSNFTLKGEEGKIRCIYNRTVTIMQQIRVCLGWKWSIILGWSGHLGQYHKTEIC